MYVWSPQLGKKLVVPSREENEYECVCVRACEFVSGRNVLEGGTNEGSVTALARPYIYMLVI